MSHDKWIEQAELYALGALETTEIAEFESHLKGRCPACEDYLRGTNNALAFLAASVPPAVPSASVKAAVMERIAMDAPPARAAGPGLKWVVLGTAALAVGYGVFIAMLNKDIDRDVKSLDAAMEKQGDFELQNREIKRYLMDPDVKLVRLEGVIEGRDVKGTLLWNPTQCSGLFLATGLELVPNGKAYEFWVIEKGKPLAAGMFVTDDNGVCQFQLPKIQMGHFDTFAITLEPGEGSSQPTGPILLSGALPAPAA